MPRSTPVPSGPPATGETEPATELLRLALSLHRVVRRGVHRVVPALPLAQAELLVTVRDHPGVSVSEAAEHLHVAANTVSTLVNQSVAAGMLRRDTDPSDRRAARLTLTEAAERHLADWRDCAVELVRDGIGRLPQKERAALAAGLVSLEHLIGTIGEVTPA